MPDVDSTRISILKDKELTSTNISVRWQHAATSDKTVADYRRSLVERLHDTMLNQRFNEISQKPDAPFLGAGVGRGNYVRPLDIYISQATAKEGQTLQALQLVLTEEERVKQHGFLQSELDRARTNVLRGYERAYEERDKSQSAGFVEEYIAHFLTGESFPGISYETELVRKYLPQVTLAEVNAMSRVPRSAANRTVAIEMPDKDGLAAPTADEIKRVFATTSSTTVAAYSEAIAEGALVTTPPTAGKVVSERRIDDIGVTEWTLSNGIHVYVKATDYKADEVLMHAWSPGGLSLLPDADVFRAQQSVDALARGGLGNFSLIDLRKKLTGKVASASAFIGETDEGLNGSASPKDLETLLQLAWLRLESPRADTTAFAAMLQQYTAALANKDANPQAVFGDTVQVTLAQGSPRAQPLNLARLNELNLARMEQIYRDRLSDATDLTFVFVGTIDLNVLKPLVEQWIASLPTSGRKEKGKDVAPPLLKGTVSKTVRKGLAPQSTSVMLFTGPATWTRDEAYLASSLGDLLEMRLTDRLREAMGGTYGVSVSSSVSRTPRQEWQTAIQFQSAPDRADTLYKAVLQEMDSLRRVPASAIEVERVREQQRRSLELSKKQNNYWVSALTSKLENGDNPSTILDADSIIAKLTPEQLLTAAKKYLDASNLARFVLQPEGAPAKP